MYAGGVYMLIFEALSITFFYFRFVKTKESSNSNSSYSIYIYFLIFILNYYISSIYSNARVNSFLYPYKQKSKNCKIDSNLR